MLYLRNTNQIQSLSQQVDRGPAGAPPAPPAPTGSLNYFDGLGRQSYKGYTNPFVNPNWPSTSVTTGSLEANSGSLVPWVTTGNVQAMTQWLGYFKASTTETYTFILTNDDEAVLWVGNAATASVLTTGSALLLSNTSNAPSIYYSASISLASGSYYPIRLQYADGQGGVFFSSSFRTPTISATSDFTNYTFCNTSSLGF